MPIIVDGYNVLHASHWLTSAWKGAQRDQLCRLLADWAEHVGEKLTIVFDAQPANPTSQPSTFGQVDVIFSGHNQTADDVIIQMINDSTGPRELTVISSDRQIKNAARRRGCKVRTAGEFIKTSAAQLAKAQAKIKKEPTEKQNGLKPKETDRWLTEFGLDPDQEEDPFEPMRRG